MKTVYVLLRLNPNEIIAIYESEENAKSFKEYIEEQNARDVEEHGSFPKKYSIEMWEITEKDALIFDTYPDYEDEDYDNVYRIFEVPRNWATEWIKQQWNATVESFVCEYTWDDTIQMYEQAIHDGVLISERIELR